jgi:FAD binding domain
LSDFHAADPFSIDYPQWANDSCDPVFPNGTTLNGDTQAGARGCTQGNYPVYAVNATSAEIISAAIKWAGQKNIRVVIKNTGHSFPGRSIGFGSLSIWTHNMRGFEFNDDWKASGCSAGNSSQKQWGVTLAAGMQDREIYALAHEQKAIVVGGSNPTVGMMGWFPGGGHGPLSSSYGMGADNLLEAVLVTPTGDIVTVNECQHSDLYWALRGGGSGTFGVIVEATVKAFPTPATIIAQLIVTPIENTAANLTSEWWKLMAEIHAQLPSIKDGGGQGYYQMVGPPAVPFLVFSIATYHYDTTNDTVTGLYQPVMDMLDQQNTFANYTFASYAAPTFFDIWNASVGQAVETVATGGNYFASRLLTKRALTEDVNAVAKTFKLVGPKAESDPVSDL